MRSKAVSHIDWDELFRWLDAGYLIQDLAMIVKLGQDRLGQRAKEELSPERHDKWKYLVRHNIYVNKNPCGTDRGVTRHYRIGEPACKVCLDHDKDMRRLRKHEKFDAGTLTYQVRPMHSPRYGDLVHVLERTNSEADQPRLIACYHDSIVANEIARYLSSFTKYEV